MKHYLCNGLHKSIKMKKLNLYLLLILVFGLGSSTVSDGQGSGVIYGVVTDGQLKDPLAFAAVGVTGTNIGINTDLDGKYRLPNVPAGTYTIVFSYLGYEAEEVAITVRSGEEVAVNMVLNQSGIKLDEVIVKGQATGQRAAINQQINSNTIVNVISQEKLQELPDQNAAESVGRLAGVSVYRDAGEGQQVSIRGISPRFNSVTVNGERLPSTEIEERSVDLSMISSDMLAGIELFKAITPDMDGDAVGGTVNFTVKKADAGFRSIVRILGTYNDLRNDYGNYRASASLSNRFFNDKLGIIINGNFQRANRSNEFLTTSYEQIGTNTETGEPDLVVSTLNLGDGLETRDRYGGGLTIDYGFNKDHTLLLSSSLGRIDRDELRYRRRYRVSNNEQRFDIQERIRNTTVLTNSLSGNHTISKFNISWRGSYSTSRQRIPRQMRGQFWELSAMTGPVANDLDLTTVPEPFKNNLANTTLRDISFQTGSVDEDRMTFQLDLKYNFTASSSFSGYFKVGGKYRRVERGRDADQDFYRPYLAGENPAQDNPELFLTKGSGGPILMANFMGDYRNDDFYGGIYDILPGTEELRNSFTTPVESVDINAYNQLFGTNFKLGDAIPYQGHLDVAKVRAFYNRFQNNFRINSNVDLEDYDGVENITAAYIMSHLNIGKKLTLTGGLRFEDTRQEYTSRSGAPEDPDDGGTGFIELIDVTASQGYSDFLPMAQMRYKFSDWMDIRLATTRTLARPNFFNLVPWERIDAAEQAISRGKPDLNHTTAWNYDIFVSFYNRFGLFTIGAFYKELDNIDFIKTSTILDGSNFQGYSLSEPANVNLTSTVRGIELDLQTNLSSLNGFWKGVIIGANLTLVRSETFYPFFQAETIFIPEPPFFETSIIDSLRSGPIVGQADLIANASLGYEAGGFSGRISMIYQTDALSPGNPGIGNNSSGVGTVEAFDFYDDSFFRFDLALKQRIDKKGRWTLLFNMNNITNTPERAFLGFSERLTSEEFFGFTADLGVLFKFK